MKRWLFHIVAASSLLLCIASAFLWVRSFRATDIVSRLYTQRIAGGIQYRSRQLLSGRGGVAFSLRHGVRTVSDERDILLANYEFRHEITPPYDSIFPNTHNDPEWLWRGFQVMRFVPNPKSDQRGATVTVPYWALIGLGAIAPTLSLWRFRQSRPLRGHCPSCGYDLRASPERCPECGAAAPKPRMSTQAP